MSGPQTACRARASRWDGRDSATSLENGMVNQVHHKGPMAIEDLCSPAKVPRLGMYDAYQPWVLHTYGDSAKTKTITRNKYRRILQILRGDFVDNESSKFKLWVKGRGFRIGPPPPGYFHQGVLEFPTSLDRDAVPDIYVQTGTIKDSEGHDRICYKKVAVVEDFFDIIYNLHVCRDGKEQKHMGQKRTYRAVSERYAFVPREAVTKFLVLCTECPRRSVGVSVALPIKNANNNNCKSHIGSIASPAVAPKNVILNNPPTSSPYPLLPVSLSRVGTTMFTPVDFSPLGTVIVPSHENHFAPLTRKQERQNPPIPVPAVAQEAPEIPLDDFNEAISALSCEVDFCLPITSIYMKHMRQRSRRSEEDKNGILWQHKEANTLAAESEGSEDELKNADVEKRLEASRGSDWTPFQQQTMSLIKGEQQRRGSPCTPSSPTGSERATTGTPLDIASNAEDTSSNGNKDEDDDDADDDNEDEKMDSPYDPERLKAFNMFVRLFVDENLDRIVPISKQPKEKIQAIIDACARQFPEFADRTRKRIRTYLKSCRRNKRSRDSNGWDTSSRPTPPHLTSIQAEQILAAACENEAQNAKRMRLGLEPIAQPNPLSPQTGNTASVQASNMDKGIDSVSVKTDPSASSQVGSTSNHAPSFAKAFDRAAGEKVLNGSSMFQTSFQQTYQKASSPGSGTFNQQSGVSTIMPSTSSSVLSNGPTDLSVKSSSKVQRPTLNAVEVAAVRQLITGYRESAAFLLRSADELENLLLHQQGP